MGRVQVIQHSANPTITGVVPAGVAPDTDEETDALLEKTRQHPPATTPRFHPAFWAAFRKPLDESSRRYISVGTPIQFQESSGKNPPDGFLEVTQNYISNSTMNDDQTLRNAEKWLEENQLQRNVYLINSESKYDFGHPRNLLDRLLFSLEPKELSRISMPLDIILKLRKQAP